MPFTSKFKEKSKMDIDMLYSRLTSVEHELDKLSTNGIATAINKLNQEVFKKTKPTGDRYKMIMSSLFKEEFSQEATLSAKVDAIIDHLGLEIKVEPERVETLPAKVKVKKIKKGRK